MSLCESKARSIRGKGNSVVNFSKGNSMFKLTSTIAILFLCCAGVMAQSVSLPLKPETARVLIFSGVGIDDVEIAKRVESALIDAEFRSALGPPHAGVVKLRESDICPTLQGLRSVLVKPRATLPVTYDIPAEDSAYVARYEFLNSFSVLRFDYDMAKCYEVELSDAELIEKLKGASFGDAVGLHGDVYKRCITTSDTDWMCLGYKARKNAKVFHWSPANHRGVVFALKLIEGGKCLGMLDPHSDELEFGGRLPSVTCNEP